MTKTLIIVAHQDDEALSCGCLIVDRVLRGHEVHVLTVYGRVYDYGRVSVDSSVDEQTVAFDEAKSILGYHHAQTGNLKEGEPGQVGYYQALELIESSLKGFTPSEIVIPSFHDLNQDHVFLNHACRIALRAGNLPRGPVRVLEAFAFDRTTTHPNWFLSHSDKTLERKLDAVAAYKTEVRPYPHPRSAIKIRAQHEVWGGMCGTALAEGYKLVLERN